MAEGEGEGVVSLCALPPPFPPYKRLKLGSFANLNALIPVE